MANEHLRYPLTPPALLGKWNALVHLFWQIGGICVTIASYFVSSEWRLMVVLSSLPGDALSLTLTLTLTLHGR